MLAPRPRGSSSHSRAGHPACHPGAAAASGAPACLRCSSLKYSRYSRSSRLTIRAPRSGTLTTNHGDGTLGLCGIVFDPRLSGQRRNRFGQ